MRNSLYFEHDYNALNDEKILDLRAVYKLEGYGFYWAFLESLARSGGFIKRKSIGGLSLGYGMAIGEVEKILEFCISLELLFEDERGIFSPRMLEHIEKRVCLSESGKRGAEKRWKNREAIATPLPSPIAEEKRREEKRKENIISSNEEMSKALEEKKEEKDFRNENVEIVLGLIREVTGRPPTSGVDSRRYAYNLSRNLKKEYPSFEISVLVKRILQAAMGLQDTWHTPKCHDPKHLWKYWQEIVALAQEKGKKDDNPGKHAF